MPPDTKQRQRECQKCLAHGVHVRFKGHKLGCFFRDCQCQRCQVVSIKRQKNKIVTAQKRRLEMENVKKIETEQANRKGSGEISDSEENHLIIDESSNQQQNPISDRRAVYCRRCQIHGVKNLVRGHKDSCPYRGCWCTECRIINCQSSVCSHCGFYPPTVTPYPRPYPPSLNWLLNQQNSTSCGGGNTSSNNYSSNLGYKPQVNYVQPATPSMPYNSTPGYMQGPHHDIPHSTVLYGTPASQQDGNLIL
ncbi:uncharacterized protein LOC143085660 [Mytilus galloprovincialis]|uniref:Putative doublesex-and mab-3-related transcription factor 1L n=1 Tax=Mytilus edulis TaxID=6550 RepID=A0A8F3IYY1_MYTED|nr:putative doublesex- and mab-3-related transcription factor 1L [Mytilus edulis]